jgi:enamine deaminase RidA (YjgF/YER057c/UK114 family)
VQLVIRERLETLGIELPTPPVPKFAYVPVVVHGGTAYVSGQLPWVNGELMAVGRLGDTVDLALGEAAARQCLLQGLAVLEQALGSLDRVDRFLKMTGFVASAPGFHDQPKVVDAASKILLAVFGERGAHARSAVGVAELPRGVAVEIELIVSVIN